jgi:AcrR family transcriptional regulator
MARKTKAEAAETRLKILDAAELMFFEHGVAQTSLEQIAEAAGVTRGAIYWHFANKVDLFKALHERVRLPQEDIVEQAAVDGHPDPLGLIEQVALDCLKIIAADVRQQRVSTILLLRCEYVGEMAGALERQRDADAVMRKNLLRIFTMARENNSLAETWTPAIAAKAFEAMMRGLWADWLRFGQSFDLVTVGSQCITELFQAFRTKQSNCSYCGI